MASSRCNCKQSFAARLSISLSLILSLSLSLSFSCLCHLFPTTTTTIKTWKAQASQVLHHFSAAFYCLSFTLHVPHESLLLSQNTTHAVTHLLSLQHRKFFIPHNMAYKNVSVITKGSIIICLTIKKTFMKIRCVSSLAPLSRVIKSSFSFYTSLRCYLFSFRPVELANRSSFFSVSEFYIVEVSTRKHDHGNFN